MAYPQRRPLTHPASLAGAVGITAVVWFALYRNLHPLADGLVTLLPISQDSRLAHALAFFLYDVPKVLMLLLLVVFTMGVVRSFFSPERTRALLSGRAGVFGNILAALLGVVTPFCSCSAVPLFIGFVSAGVPLGITFSFLIAAPMVNEVALGLLFGLVGWRVALAYLGFGLTLAVVAGWIIGQLRLEHWLQDWVRAIQSGVALNKMDEALTWPARLRMGIEAVRDILGRVWLWVLLGIALGAAIHGYVPQETMARIMGADAWWSVPAAVALGIPMYTNAAGVIPIVEALLGKGAALGTTLAFMMSVIALSLPEMIILRKVLTWRLIAVFIGVVGSGILCIGYLFNLLF